MREATAVRIKVVGARIAGFAIGLAAQGYELPWMKKVPPSEGARGT